MVERKRLDANHNTKVLYLSYDGLTDPLGQSQILPYLCGLANNGYAITVISFEKNEKIKISRDKVSNLCRAHKIDWVPLKYHKRPPILSTLFDLFRLRLTVLRLHGERSFSIVHCRSYLTALIGAWLKQKHQVKFLFDMRGFWVDERVEGGLWNLRNPIYRIMYKYFKRKEKEFIKEADAIVVLTEAARQELVSWQLNSKITIIPCCVDLKEFNPDRFTRNERNEIRSQLEIRDDDYVLLYLGSLGTWYLYTQMVLFFKAFKKIKPAVKFLFITQDIEKVESDPDFIVCTIPRKDVPKYIYACDASICFIKPSFSKKGSSATKMAEILAMGLPIITNSGWGDVAFLSKTIDNIFIEDNCDQSFIKEFLKKRSAKAQNDFFSDLFSLESGVKRYSQVYSILRETMLARNE